MQTICNTAAQPLSSKKGRVDRLPGLVLCALVAIKSIEQGQQYHCCDHAAGYPAVRLYRQFQPVSVCEDENISVPDPFRSMECPLCLRSNKQFLRVKGKAGTAFDAIDSSVNLSERRFFK